MSFHLALCCHNVHMNARTYQGPAGLSVTWGPGEGYPGRAPAKTFRPGFYWNWRAKTHASSWVFSRTEKRNVSPPHSSLRPPAQGYLQAVSHHLLWAEPHSSHFFFYSPRWLCSFRKALLVCHDTSPHRRSLSQKATQFLVHTMIHPHIS